MRNTVKWISIMSVLSLLLGAVLIACTAEAPPAPAPAPKPAPAPAPAPAPKPAPEKTVELKVSVHYPETHHLSKNLVKPWVDLVNREGKGRLKATIYYGGVLAKAEAAYEAVLKGSIDVTTVVSVFTPQYFLATILTEVPFGGPNSVVGTEVLHGPIFEKYLAKEWANVKLLGGIAQSAKAQLLTKKPVRKLEDLKGMKLSVSGGMQVKALEAIGGVPVTIPSPGLYEGIQRGTIDGAWFFYGSASGYRLWEVVPNMTEVNYGGTALAWVMNKGLWESLPRDLQLVIEYASKDAGYWQGWSYYTDDMVGKQLFLKNGTKEISFPAEDLRKMRALVEPEWQKFIEQTAKQGVPAREIYEFYMSQPELYGMR